MKRLPFRLISFAQGTLSPVEGVGRWLFNLAAVVSLILFLATSAFWMRSRGHFDIAGVHWDRLESDHRLSREISLMSGLGGMTFIGSSYPLPLASRQNTFQWMSSSARSLNKLIKPTENGSKRNVLGCEIGRLIKPMGTGTFSQEYWVTIPHSVVAAMLVILPAIRAYAWQVRKRKITPPHACSQCGYDLRATPDRCPECGEIPKAAEARRP